MLDPKESGVTMPSTHKISFSIIDILDPKKFNSKRANELSVVAEKFPVPDSQKKILRSVSSAAGGDCKDECAEAGEKRGNFELLRMYAPVRLLRRLFITKEVCRIKKIIILTWIYFL